MFKIFAYKTRTTLYTSAPSSMTVTEACFYITKIFSIHQVRIIYAHRSHLDVFQPLVMLERQAYSPMPIHHPTCHTCDTHSESNHLLNCPSGLQNSTANTYQLERTKQPFNTHAFSTLKPMHLECILNP